VPGDRVVAAAGLMQPPWPDAAVVVMLSAVLGGHDPRSPLVRLLLIKQRPGHPAARRTRPAPAAPVTSTSPLTRALLSVPGV